MRTVAGAVVSAKAVSLSKAAKILELFDVEAHKPGSYVRPDAAAYVRRASVAANQQARLHRELKHQRSYGANVQAIQGQKADEAAENKEKRRKGVKEVVPSVVDGKQKKRNEIKEENKGHGGEISRKEVAGLVSDDNAEEKKEKKKKKRRREEGNQDMVGELARAEESKDMKEEKVHFDVALSRKDAELVLSNGMTDVKSNKKKRVKEEEENKDFGGESVRAVMGVTKEKRKGTKEEEEKKMDVDTSNKTKKNKKKEGGDDIHTEEKMSPIMVLEDKESKKKRKKEEKKKRRKEEKEEGRIEKAVCGVPLDVSINDKKEKKRKKRKRELYGITGGSDKEPMQLLDHSEQPKN